jgi:Na+/H+-dicarboxylate symporter
MLGSPLETINYLHPRNIKSLSDMLGGLMRGRLWLQVLVAMVLGVATGLVLSPDAGFVSKTTALAIGEWLALPGMLFLAFIQMIVVPLITASIVRGICSATDAAQLKSTGLFAAIYFIGTTILAVVIGIAVGLIIKPGSYVDAGFATQNAPRAETRQSAATKAIGSESVNAGEAAQESLTVAEVPDRIAGVLPTNPMASIVEGEMLQIVIFAIVIGIGLLSIRPASAKPLLELFGSIQQVSMAIVGAVMRIAPLAVFGLLARTMIKTGPDVLAGMGVYAGTVVLGMFVLLLVYGGIATLFGGQGPTTFIRGFRAPFLLGFSTNSSAATMPVTVKSAEEELNIRPSIAQFVIPLGATINMGGTALYQGLATIFMAQMFAIDLPLSTLIALVATAVGASIGTPAVPGVGIIVLATVLSSVGVPVTGLSLIIGLDRILERFRTALNVTGDLAGCAVIDNWTGDHTRRAAEHAQEAELEAELEEQRRRDREDVIVRG